LFQIHNTNNQVAIKIKTKLTPSSLMKTTENQPTVTLNKITFCFALIALIALQSCTKKDLYQPVDTNAIHNGSNNNGEGEGSESASQSGSNNSHNAGQNCMNCHTPGGSGAEKLWKVAGTVYNEDLVTANTNATIKFYTGPDGTGVLKYTLTSDVKGNFYTASNIDFSAGLYPVATGTTNSNYMSSPITTGECNSCHDGVNRSRVWTN
jgi:hypothetical protein